MRQQNAFVDDIICDIRTIEPQVLATQTMTSPLWKQLLSGFPFCIFRDDFWWKWVRNNASLRANELIWMPVGIPYFRVFQPRPKLLKHPKNQT